MSENPASEAPTRRKRIVRVVLGCVAAGAVVAGVGLVVTNSTAADVVAQTPAKQTSSALPTPGTTGDPTPSASPTEASPTAGPSNVTGGGSEVEPTPLEGLPATEDLVPEDLLDAGLGAPIAAFTNAFQALSQLEAGSEGLAGLEQVADGAALMELQAQAAETMANDWSFEGDAVVVSANIEETEDKGERESMRVIACIDSSSIVMKDLNGATIQAADPAGSRRSLNIYDLEQRDQTWVVVDHSFPNDADC